MTCLESVRLTSHVLHIDVVTKDIYIYISKRRNSAAHNTLLVCRRGGGGDDTSCRPRLCAPDIVVARFGGGRRLRETRERGSSSTRGRDFETTTTTTRARIAGGDVIDGARVTAKAAEAILDVSKTVRMKGIDAPKNEKSYVALDAENAGVTDDDGLPLVYAPEAIQTYWTKQGGALQQRWLEFLKESVPFLTRVASLSLQGGSEELTKNGASLAKDAREIIQRLGPTYIKAGQMMSGDPTCCRKRH